MAFTFSTPKTYLGPNGPVTAQQWYGPGNTVVTIRGNPVVVPYHYFLVQPPNNGTPFVVDNATFNALYVSEDISDAGSTGGTTGSTPAPFNNPVSFQKTFTNPPNVQLTQTQGPDLKAEATNITTTGFTLITNATPAASTTYMWDWLAVEPAGE